VLNYYIIFLLVFANLTFITPSINSAEADKKVLGKSYVSPGGITRYRSHLIFTTADTELAGYPHALLGWRYGLFEYMDIGLAIGGIPVKGPGVDSTTGKREINLIRLIRIDTKFILWQNNIKSYFAGLRIRSEFKRHNQVFLDSNGNISSEFRPINDFGPSLAIEPSIAWRLGNSQQHVLYYSTSYYFDLDIRSDHKRLEHYYLPIMLGYEFIAENGFHFQIDVATFLELFNTQTAGQFIPRFRIRFAFEL